MIVLLKLILYYLSILRHVKQSIILYDIPPSQTQVRQDEEPLGAL